MNSEGNKGPMRRQSGPRIYFGIGLLCFLVSVYAATNLLSVPFKNWQPIDVAETLFGFLIFLYLSRLGLSGKHAMAPEGHQVAQRPSLPNFFVLALLVGLAMGGGVAYWQGTAMGWSVAGAAGLAIAITVVSGGAILAMVRLVRR